MERQLSVVTLEVLPAVDDCVPGVEVERIANIICDAVQSKSCSLIGSMPFRITVERMDEAASAPRERMEHGAEEFPEIEEPIRERAKSVEAVVTK